MERTNGSVAERNIVVGAPVIHVNGDHPEDLGIRPFSIVFYSFASVFDTLESSVSDP